MPTAPGTPPVATIAGIESRETKKRDINDQELALMYRYRRSQGLIRYPVSGLSRTKSRTDLLADRQILQKLSKKLKKGGIFSLTDAPLCPVKNTGTPHRRTNLLSRKRWGLLATLERKAKRHFSKTTDSVGDLVTTVHLPHWDHVSDIIKCAAYGAAMASDRCFAFTLHCSPEMVEAALRSPRGFTGFFQGRIAATFRKAFPDHPTPAFVLCVEGAWYQDCIQQEPLHLHGAVEIPKPRENDLLDDPKSSVEDALRDAAGMFNGRKAARQLKMTKMTNPFGWFSYVAKQRLCTLEALKHERHHRGIRPRSNEAASAACREIRCRGRAWFERARSTKEFIAIPRPPRKPGGRRWMQKVPRS